MSTTAHYCLGCGTSLPIGSYRRLLCSDATKHVLPVWREVLCAALEIRGVVIDEESVLSEKQGFICRKCFRAFESFKAAKEKLLQSANTALQFIPTTPAVSDGTGHSRRRRRSLEEGDYAHDLIVPSKRPRTAQNPSVGASPSVKVISR